MLTERGVMATMLGGGHYRLHLLSWRFGAHAQKYMIHLHVPPTAGLRYLFTILSALFWYTVDSPDDPFQVQCTGTVASGPRERRGMYMYRFPLSRVGTS